MKVIKNYAVVWKDHPNSETMSVSIESALEIMAAWANGAKAVMIKGGMYSTAMIARIEPVWITGHYHAERMVKDGTAITEKQLEEKIKQMNHAHKNTTGPSVNIPPYLTTGGGT
jgi:hypothetical protein